HQLHESRPRELLAFLAEKTHGPGTNPGAGVIERLHAERFGERADVVERPEGPKRVAGIVALANHLLKFWPDRLVAALLHDQQRLSPPPRIGVLEQVRKIGA